MAESVTTLAKIVPFEKAAALCETLRAQGRRIVHCHGTFDLLHPGYIDYFEEARSLGDILVATLTAEEHVSKGPGRPYFNDPMRARTLAALSCVDHVVIVPFPGSKEAIDCVRPHIYCKGREHEKPDREGTGHFPDDVKFVEKVGGKIRYVGSVSFSSTRLLNRYFEHLEPPVREFCHALAVDFSSDDFREAVESFAHLKILVIGDTIFDRYSYVKVQGLTSKNQIISGRFVREELQCGGALAAFRHVRQFTNQVRFLSLVGTEPWVETVLREQLAPSQDLVVREEGFTTVIKQRYVEPLNKGKELSKLFAVNYLDADPPPKAVQEKVLARMTAEIDKVDLVLLLDFGHGLMQTAVRQAIQDSAPFLALNCQTNSNNHGFNIISRQYQRADAFSLDAQELMLACGQRHPDFSRELDSLRRQLRARYGWLTRGPVETIGETEGQPTCLCPPLENDIVDTVGAGDAFFSVAALAAAQKLPVRLGTFIGQLAGAQAVKIVGNAEPISKPALLQSGISLLNF
jgi:cytidyltransferase-like protein